LNSFSQQTDCYNCRIRMKSKFANQLYNHFEISALSTMKQSSNAVEFHEDLSTPCFNISSVSTNFSAVHNCLHKSRKSSLELETLGKSLILNEITSSNNTSTLDINILTIRTKDIKNKDVLCGRNQLSFNHHGNKEFRAFMNTQRSEYENISRMKDKTKLIDKIIREIKNSGARFLKREDIKEINCRDSWFIIDDQCIHEKVSHALRSKRDRKLYKRSPIKKKKFVKAKLKDGQQQYFQKLLKLQQVAFKEFLKKEEIKQDKILNQQKRISNLSKERI